jgi:hypothetical protein
MRTEEARAGVVEADRGGWGAAGTEEEKKERELAGTLTSALVVFKSPPPAGPGRRCGTRAMHPPLESSHGTR